MFDDEIDIKQDISFDDCDVDIIKELVEFVSFANDIISNIGLEITDPTCYFNLNTTSYCHSITFTYGLTELYNSEENIYDPDDPSSDSYKLTFKQYLLKLLNEYIFNLNRISVDMSIQLEAIMKNEHKQR